MYQCIARANRTTFFALAVAGCATTHPSRPPEIALTVPPAFATSLTVTHYRAGEDILNSPPYRVTTVAPMTEYWGCFGPKVAPQAEDHLWRIRVCTLFSPKVADAFASAGDGFQADLNESPEFLGLNERSYMYARFEHKHFHWGDAVSFFSQFSQDTGLYVPHNGHLTDEVWGVTHDYKHTVVAKLHVSHSKLAVWGPEVRDATSIEALKQDPDFKLVETCSPKDFQPGLTWFDQMLESLVIRMNTSNGRSS